MLDADDLDLQAKAIVTGKPLDPYDENKDGKVSYSDRELWVHDFKNTYIGDADLNGEFNSNDFVQAFQAGKYETTESAGWSEGDWNGDGLFKSDDFIIAFQDGGYEQGPRTDAAAVPEPGGVVLMSVALGLIFCCRR